ncbi:MAG: hypothetical protein ABUT39_30020 [Acidobacteriota bacterium]
MIRCKTCSKEFPDDTPLVVCDRCGAVLDKGAASAAPSLPTVGSDEPPLPRPGTVRRIPPRPAPAPEPVEEDEDSALDPDHLDTITAFGKKQAIVTVIGFGGSGKTFWVNRLRDELPNRSWRSNELPEEEITLSPAGIQLTKFIPPAEAGRASRPYLVVDCAGESLVQALERQSGTDSLKGSAVRSYLVALACASAYVLVINAEQLLQYREEISLNATQTTRKNQEVIRTIIDGFYKIIAGMVAARERLAGGQDPEKFLREGVSREELGKIFERSHLRCPQPLYIALAQADLLIKDTGNDGVDSDPFLFALQYGRKLFKAIHPTFDQYRFDYLSAFYGHDGSSIRPNYSNKHFGAVEAFEWIHDRVSSIRGVTRNTISTRESVEMRLRLDPQFRQAWGDGR